MVRRKSLPGVEDRKTPPGQSSSQPKSEKVGEERALPVQKVTVAVDFGTDAGPELRDAVNDAVVGLLWNFAHAFTPVAVNVLSFDVDGHPVVTDEPKRVTEDLVRSFRALSGLSNSAEMLDASSVVSAWVQSGVEAVLAGRGPLPEVEVSRLILVIVRDTQLPILADAESIKDVKESGCAFVDVVYVYSEGGQGMGKENGAVLRSLTQPFGLFAEVPAETPPNHRTTLRMRLNNALLPLIRHPTIQLNKEAFPSKHRARKSIAKSTAEAKATEMTSSSSEDIKASSSSPHHKRRQKSVSESSGPTALPAVEASSSMDLNTEARRDRMNLAFPHASTTQEPEEMTAVEMVKEAEPLEALVQTAISVSEDTEHEQAGHPSPGPTVSSVERALERKPRKTSLKPPTIDAKHPSPSLTPGRVTRSRGHSQATAADTGVPAKKAKASPEQLLQEMDLTDDEDKDFKGQDLTALVKERKEQEARERGPVDNPAQAEQRAKIASRAKP